MQVTFIDYGNMQTVPLTSLTRLMPHECQLPAQALECYLTCVRPAAAHSTEGSAWADTANTHFEDIVCDRRLVARVRGSAGRGGRGKRRKRRGERLGGRDTD